MTPLPLRWMQGHAYEFDIGVRVYYGVYVWAYNDAFVQTYFLTHMHVRAWYINFLSNVQYIGVQP